MCEAITKRGRVCRRVNVKGETRCSSHLSHQECSICFESGVNRKLKCGHWYHQTCFEEWAKRQGETVTCPLCRRVECQTIRESRKIDAQAVMEVLQQLFPLPREMLDQVVQHLVQELSDER